MPIRVTCRHCGKSFSAWEDLIGKPVQCPKCQQLMTVPGDVPSKSTPLDSSAPPAGNLSGKGNLPNRQNSPNRSSDNSGHPPKQTSPPASPSKTPAVPAKKPTLNLPSKAAPASASTPTKPVTPKPVSSKSKSPKPEPPKPASPVRKPPTATPVTHDDDDSLPLAPLDDDLPLAPVDDEMPIAPLDDSIPMAPLDDDLPVSRPKTVAKDRLSPVARPSLSVPPNLHNSGAPPIAASTTTGPINPMRVVPQQRAKRLHGNEEIPFACPSCSAPMSANDDLCNECGYHRLLKKKIDLEGVHREPKESGAAAYLSESLASGESMGSVGIWAGVLGTLMLLVIGILFHPISWFIVVPLGIAIGVYSFNQARLKEQLGDYYTPGILEQITWSAALVFVRMSGFRRPYPPFSPLPKEVRREETFGDQDLEQLDRLTDLRALDLEGTSVTDDGLECLLDNKRLQYLVLKRTGVTKEGVRSLQKHLRRTWIWH